MNNVFRNKNFCLVFLGALVSEIGALLYSFAVSFYILQISGNSAFIQGLYLALCGAAMLVFTPVGGVLGDRMNKAEIMYTCDFIKGGTIILATILMLVFSSANAHIVILFILGIIGNVISGIFNPAAGALIPHIVESEQLQQANSYFMIKSSVEGILGVVLAGILYAALPVHILFFMVGACFIASGISEMMIRYTHIQREGQLTMKVALNDMREGLSYLKTQKAILALLGSVLFINFFIAPITGNFIPFFVRTDLAGASSYLLDNILTPELWSSVISVCLAIGSLIGAAIMSARKPAEKCGAAVAMRLCANAVVIILLALSYFILVDCGNALNIFLPMFCIGGAVSGMQITFVNIPVSTAIMRIVDKDKLSKVNSIINIGTQGMIPIASVLAGGILQAFGSSALLFFCPAGFTVTAILLLMNKPVKML